MLTVVSTCENERSKAKGGAGGVAGWCVRGKNRFHDHLTAAPKAFSAKTDALEIL